MKQIKTLLLSALLIFSISFPAFADTYVRGYTGSDGTYVAPYYRSSPNQYRYDNYSAQGNTNPYTGERGYQRHEFTNPPAYNESYDGSGYDYDPYDLYGD